MPDGISPTASPEEIKNYINTNMPDMSYLLNNDEVFNTIVKWAHNDAPDTDLASMIRHTQYWIWNSPQARAWDDQVANDPAAAEQRLTVERGNVQRALSNMGDIRITDQEVTDLATQVIKGGWTADDLNRHLVEGYKNSGRTTDNENVTSAQMIAEASKYGLSMAKDTADQFAMQMQAKTMTPDGFTNWLNNQAKSRWSGNPDVTKALADGIKPVDFFSSARNTIAQTLEIDPNQVDVFSGQFAGVTSHYDDKAKVTRSMTLPEVRQLAMQDDRVKQTSWYQAQDANWSLNIAKKFATVPPSA